jgi:hypothetical protein
MCLLRDACFMVGFPFVAALANFLFLATVYLTRKLCYTLLVDQIWSSYYGNLVLNLVMLFIAALLSL